ncbi:hypothetical protein ACVR0S_04690 [Streptococcus dentapri]|uniref:Uncharacterized protein n=1 Tax=Streptococcus dentapri TaxID=573564 RepID=A0ABV8D344_9STRE
MKKLTFFTLLAIAATILVIFINPNQFKNNVTALTGQSSSQTTAASTSPSSSISSSQLDSTIVSATPGTYKTEDGAKVTVNENGSFKASYSNGTTLITYTDNTYYYQAADGSEARTYADETYFITTATGTSLTTYQDGTYQVNLADGTTLDPSNSTNLETLQSQYNLPRIDSYDKIVKDLVDELDQKV